MASGYDYNLLKESNEVSNDSISNSGSSVKVEDGNDHRGYISSCPAVMEPSKDKLLLSHEKIGRHKNLAEEYVIRSCPQPSTGVIPGSYADLNSSEESSISEDEQHRSHELQIMDGQQLQVVKPITNCCISCMDFYNKYARIIRNSWFIYIFQLFVSGVCISTIVMGIIFFQSCEGNSSIAVQMFNIVLGLSSLLLVYKWVGKVRRERSGQRYWNFEKDKLVWYLVLVFFFMILEYILSIKMTPIALQAKQDDIKCPKTYSDYLHYMHITNAGILGLAALLYLPDCCIYMSVWHHLTPSHRNGHYEPL